jgi:4'-phosphopantetheinyl transferase
MLPGQYDPDSVYAILSAEEKAKADKFKFEKDRYRSIVCRGFLRRLLGQYLGLDPKAVLIHHTALGKPYLRSFEGEKNVCFNVSHSAERAIFGFSLSQRIGVDIEYTEKKIDGLEIAQRFFSEEEALFLKNTPEQYRSNTFYKYWSLKEAYLKGLGTGLSKPMNTFSVQPRPCNSAYRIRQHHPTSQHSEWTLRVVTSMKYVAAVAAEGEGWKLKLMAPNGVC